MISCALRPALAASLLCCAAAAQGTPIDLSTWTPVQYEFFTQPDANWQLQQGNTAVLQTANSDAGILLSDFDATGQEIEGTWRVETLDDDDFMGFVFGYQDRGAYYLLDWKKATQPDPIGLAEVGMTLKAVHTPAGTDPANVDLWPTAGSANVTPLLHNSIPWVTNVDYTFKLAFQPGHIDITVSQAGQVLERWVLADSTYTSGKFGFYNYSQSFVRYEGFTQQDIVSTYCTAKVNSQGCQPLLATSGFASLSDPTPFTISASLLVNQMNADLFLSQSGAAALPFNGGLLCLTVPILDTPLRFTGGNTVGFDCSGSLTFDVNAWLQSGGVPGVAAGDTLHAQYFYRDVPHADGFGTGLTEAVEFIVQP